MQRLDPHPEHPHSPTIIPLAHQEGGTPAGNFPEPGDHRIQGVPEGRQGQAQGRGTFPLGTWGWHGQGAVMAAVPPTADRRGGTDRQPAATLLRQHRQAAAQEVTRLQHSLSIPRPRPAANVWGEYSSIHCHIPAPCSVLPCGTIGTLALSLPRGLSCPAPVCGVGSDTEPLSPSTVAFPVLIRTQSSVS